MYHVYPSTQEQDLNRQPDLPDIHVTVCKATKPARTDHTHSYRPISSQICRWIWRGTYRGLWSPMCSEIDTCISSKIWRSKARQVMHLNLRGKWSTDLRLKKFSTNRAHGPINIMSLSIVWTVCTREGVTRCRWYLIWIVSSNVCSIAGHVAVTVWIHRLYTTCSLET